MRAWPGKALDAEGTVPDGFFRDLTLFLAVDVVATSRHLIHPRLTSLLVPPAAGMYDLST